MQLSWSCLNLVQVSVGNPLAFPLAFARPCDRRSAMAPKEVEVTKAEVEAKQETKDVEMKDAEKDEQAGTAAEVQKSDEPEAEKPKEPEKPKELEEDSKVDKRAKVKDGAVVMNFADSTMNVMPIAGGKLLMTLTDGGMQYLLAGVRGTAGMKSGRYMFEVKIVESLSPAETQGNGSANTPQPRQLVRVGFSLASSSLFLSDGPDNVCFDSEGYFIHGNDRKKASQKFARDQTVAVLLNLDASSPNANTISLFRNGVRISEPQPLPENLRGKVLYPTINYKNVTLQINLGPSPRQPLPFSCRMLADAASADVELAKLPVAGAKNEVVFPVGLPEQGFFDWVDDFVEKNPGYTELSDRKMQEWAYKSGVYRAKAQGGSNDKPSMKTGIPLMDDLSISRAIAPTLKRNYVVAELKSRAQLLGDLPVGGNREICSGGGGKEAEMFTRQLNANLQELRKDLGEVARVEPVRVGGEAVAARQELGELADGEEPPVLRASGLRDRPPSRRPFEAAVSLGPNCLAAYRIAKAGFKRRSFPFDIMMSGSDGWPAHEEACWGAPVGLRLAVECLSREPPFSDYVSKMAPLPHINAVGNCGFIEPGVGFIPSAHCHDDPREPSVARTYARRATRLIQLLASSGYRVLFVYTLRLRDLYSPKHVCSIAAELPKEVARLRKTLSRCWPELDDGLLVVVVVLVVVV
ncbi:unnamed protein product, partial [Polarella glacialis]